MTAVSTHAGVEALVARCLLDPEFLRDAAVDGGAALTDRNLPPELLHDLAQLDLERVRQFAGFITKVQNNHLWKPFPFTRALMKYYGIEIETFAEFRGEHLALRATGASRDARIAAFADFLDERLGTRGGLPGLRDILRHERIGLELTTAAAPADSRFAREHNGPAGYAALVPAIRGVLRVATFTCNPIEIAATISRGEPGAVELEAGPVCLAYVGGPEAQQLRVLEIDELTAALLVRVDGRCSVGAIATSVAGETQSAQLVARVRPIFDAAQDAGIIALRGAA
jgi:hypothetical protein